MKPLVKLLFVLVMLVGTVIVAGCNQEQVDRLLDILEEEQPSTPPEEPDEDTDKEDSLADQLVGGWDVTHINGLPIAEAFLADMADDPDFEGVDIDVSAGWDYTFHDEFIFDENIFGEGKSMQFSSYFSITMSDDDLGITLRMTIFMDGIGVYTLDESTSTLSIIIEDAEVWIEPDDLAAFVDTDEIVADIIGDIGEAELIPITLSDDVLTMEMSDGDILTLARKRR